MIKHEEDGSALPSAGRQEAQCSAGNRRQVAAEQTENQNGDLAFLQVHRRHNRPVQGRLLTHRNVIANILRVTGLAGAANDADEVLVTALPLYHHVFAPFASVMFFTRGGTNILITNPRDPEMFIKVIKDAGFTAILGVNTCSARC